MILAICLFLIVVSAAAGFAAGHQAARRRLARREAAATARTRRARAAITKACGLAHIVTRSSTAKLDPEVLQHAVNLINEYEGNN